MCWGSTDQRFQVELTKTVTNGSPRTEDISSSTKLKCNTKSSCESEIVGVDDVISVMLWSLYFIQAQGHDMSNVRLFQDNKSTILLENNGKMTSSSRTKHIKNKYFFITDIIEQGDIVVEWKPTDEMWIDINTKPKMGLPFRKDRAMLMNCPINLPDESLPGQRGSQKSVLTGHMDTGKL